MNCSSCSWSSLPKTLWGYICSFFGCRVGEQYCCVHHSGLVEKKEVEEFKKKLEKLESIEAHFTYMKD